MRQRKMLMMMAGLAPTPQERANSRMERKFQRLARQTQLDNQLVVLIERRQRGDEGTKPMPLAIPKESQT